MLKDSQHKTNLLQEKPQRRQGSRLALLLCLLGGIVILGAGLVVAWHQIHAANNAPVSATPQPGKNQTANNNAVSPWANYPAVYWQTLRTQMAQGFHMSEQQMKSTLQTSVPPTADAASQPKSNSAPDVGKPLSDLAIAQNITQEQLHTMEVNAVQQAHTVLVSQGILTQQQADENIQAITTMDQSSLNWHIIDAFVNH